MTDEKWTPGPWITSGPTQGKSAGQWTEVLTDTDDVCDVVEICTLPPWEIDLEEKNANAQLIAAAPDLYEALSLILDLGIAMPGPLFNKSIRALAKARGGK